MLVPLGAMLLDSLGPRAAAHTYVFYDPRQRGRSDSLPDSTRATFDNDVADLEAVRSALGISRVAVLGYDYFAAVAVAYAARHPSRVTRLVLVSPIEPSDSLTMAYDPPERLARLDTTTARALVKARAFGTDTLDPAGYCRQFWTVNAPIFVGDTTIAAVVDPTWCDLRQETPAWLGRHLGHVFASLGEDRDFTSLARRVRVPAVVIHGDRDLVASAAGAEAWVRLLPNARLVMLPGIGHLPFIEAPGRLMEVVGGFLQD